MTSVLPAPAAAEPETATPSGRWVRVTVLSPRGRADVALPADVAVAELVPMVRELIGGTPADGVPQGWRFTGPGGGPLPPDATPEDLRIRDGELLHLGPPRTAPAPPVVDDAADALAEAVREAAADTGRPAGALAAASAVLAACAVLATVAGPLRPAAAGLAALGAVVGLYVARRRSGPDAVAAAGCAVPFAATAGLLALPAGPPLTPGTVLLAAAAGGAAAAAGSALAGTASAVLAAAALTASGIAAAALARLLLDAPTAAVAAGLALPMLAAGPLLPRLALRLAGVPAPAVPTDLDGLDAAERGPGPELPARAALARALHTGTLAGTALPAAGGAAVAASGGGWAGGLLVAVTAAVLLLRARALAEPGPARMLAGIAVLGVAGAAVPAALAHGPGVRLGAAAALGLAVLVGGAMVRVTPSPPARRALDVTELLLTAAAIPAALAAMGLFTWVRGL